MIALAEPSVALIFGLFMLCAETCNHFEDLLLARSNLLGLSWYDWTAGVFLVYAAVQTRRDWITGRPIQIAAWAFILSSYPRGTLEGILFGFRTPVHPG